tara:strand:+ start:516 stop:695 length:180 start_codon:yes stop_codon:yes gene_type:complete
MREKLKWWILDNLPSVWLLLIIILAFVLISGCSSNKEIKNHRLIVSIAKQVVAPGIGFK